MQHRFQKLCRMSLRSVLLGWILVVLAVPVHAAGEEETIARNFLKFLWSDKAILSSEVLQGNLLDPALPPVTTGHLFHLQGGGYLLISPDRSISPVKAYSLVGEFSALPEPYRKALLSELELRVRVALEATGRMPLDAGKSTGARWDFLLTYEPGRTPLAYTEGTALLQTRWNQQYPYNKFLPQVGGETVVTGCVNVAVAQVMRYHRHPVVSQGVVSYLWDGPPEQALKAILYRSYNWDNMPATADSTTPEYQADEVALLIRDIGIANHTDFDFGGSSTSLNAQALMENFGYSTSLDSMSNTVYPAFLAKIQSEIAAERPVLLTFPGHMTVADGYQTHQAGVSVHINLGWGGVDDDFYFLDQPIHAGNYIFPVSSGALTIHYSIKPCSTAAGDCAVNLEAGDGSAGLAIAGNFNRARDTDLFEVYLKGPTTIRGTRGYGQLGFFMSINRMADGSEVFQPPDPGTPGDANRDFAVGSLAAGKYTIRVSLCNVDGYCYSPQIGYDRYTVTLTSGVLTAGEMAGADQELERPPAIGNVLPDLLLKTSGGIRRILVDARDENGDAVTLGVQNSNPAAVGAALNGNLLELTPTGAAKVSSRIVVTATANGKAAEKAFTVMTDHVDTAFGKAFTVGGTLVNNTDDFNMHRVILDGSCSIHGDNGFTTQGFYSSVLDGGGNVIMPAVHPPTDINGNFGRAIYQLGAALYMVSGGSTRYFTTGIGAPYILEVTCLDADQGTPTIAGILGIDLTGVSLPFDKPGDINDDGFVTLADAVFVMQMLSGMDMTGKKMILRADANGDQRVGLAEALFILQRAGGLRSSSP